MIGILLSLMLDCSECTGICFFMIQLTDMRHLPSAPTSFSDAFLTHTQSVSRSRHVPSVAGGYSAEGSVRDRVFRWAQSLADTPLVLFPRPRNHRSFPYSAEGFHGSAASEWRSLAGRRKEYDAVFRVTFRKSPERYESTSDSSVRHVGV